MDVPPDDEWFKTDAMLAHELGILMAPLIAAHISCEVIFWLPTPRTASPKAPLRSPMQVGSKTLAQFPLSPCICEITVLFASPPVNANAQRVYGATHIELPFFVDEAIVSALDPQDNQLFTHPVDLIAKCSLTLYIANLYLAQNQVCD